MLAAGTWVLGASIVQADGNTGTGSTTMTTPPATMATPLAKSKKPKKSKKAAKAQSKKEVWVCPMGDYTGDKPGKCPNCGMDLVEKK